MVAAAVWILSIAVAAGTLLGLLHLRATGADSRPPNWAGIAHGIAGTAGLIALVLALQGPPRGVQQGAGSFGTTAAWLFAGSVLTGAVVFVRRRHAPAATMAIHAGIAITGYALLLAWDSF